MSSAVATTEVLDPHVAAVIARAEARRVVLERLTVIGMELVEDIRARNVQAPEPRHDPARAFAAVSRAVRLTLAFAGRIDADILAMRNGDAASPSRSSAGSRPAAAPKRAADKPDFAYPSTLALGPEGVRVRDAVGSAIEAKFAAFDGAMGALDELHERLVDYETQDRFASRPWRECAEVLCAELGLEPDWGRWSEETGFVGPVGKPAVKWTMLWSYDPKRSEQRRRRKADPPESG
jgi:hypothetical protein